MRAMALAVLLVAGCDVIEPEPDPGGGGGSTRHLYACNRTIACSGTVPVTYYVGTFCAWTSTEAASAACQGVSCPCSGSCVSGSQTCQ